MLTQEIGRRSAFSLRVSLLSTVKVSIGAKLNINRPGTESCLAPVPQPKGNGLVHARSVLECVDSFSIDPQAILR